MTDNEHNGQVSSYSSIEKNESQNYLSAKKI